MSQWTAYYTAEGKPYYHNHFTDATQWTKPDDMSDGVPAPEVVGKPTEMPEVLGGIIAPPAPIKVSVWTGQNAALLLLGRFLGSQSF
ncbi:MAG: uncharacterized protein KVP18_000248 [Porospora cf. gigantea A]|uniref:uncharacterized protein n=1 Tax=Porospora cf. gigantea A TaxID=2853593 RepID=UPI00355A9E2A|nr:MAG: hypothetical protein KVP18_000248 [Porospora cf. gigantea A]